MNTHWALVTPIYHTLWSLFAQLIKTCFPQPHPTTELLGLWEQKFTYSWHIANNPEIVIEWIDLNVVQVFLEKRRKAPSSQVALVVKNPPANARDV